MRVRMAVPLLLLMLTVMLTGVGVAAQTPKQDRPQPLPDLRPLAVVAPIGVDCQHQAVRESAVKAFTIYLEKKGYRVASGNEVEKVFASYGAKPPEGTQIRESLFPPRLVQTEDLQEQEAIASIFEPEILWGAGRRCRGDLVLAAFLRVSSSCLSPADEVFHIKVQLRLTVMDLRRRSLVYERKPKNEQDGEGLVVRKVSGRFEIISSMNTDLALSARMPAEENLPTDNSLQDAADAEIEGALWSINTALDDFFERFQRERFS